MKSCTRLIACLMAAVFTQTAGALDTAAPAETAASRATDSTPVAYVYVSTATSGAPNQIRGFAAAPDGRLTELQSSPFAANVVSMAVTGTYLFGADTNGSDIDSFSIAGDGTLKQVASINALTASGTNCPNVGPLLLDHTGATLYVAVDTGGDCDSEAQAAFKIDKKNGELQYLGISTSIFLFNSPLSFLSDNKFAYGSACIDYQGNYLDTFGGLRRESTGMLNYANVSLPSPQAKSGETSCVGFTAADPDLHLAVSVQAISGGDTAVGAPQLATYSADSSGNLSTKSTYQNMPTTKVLNISTLSMSPSGKLLAVSGAQGLEVFHFNGSSPITHYTGLLNKHDFSPNTPSPGLTFWDNSNHLYAISPAGDQMLRVFTITPTSAKLAGGSPMPVSGVQNLIVLPKR